MNNPFSNIVLGWIWRRSGQELSSDHPWAAGDDWRCLCGLHVLLRGNACVTKEIRNNNPTVCVVRGTMMSHKLINLKPF
jgi:hypothetical protein